LSILIYEAAFPRLPIYHEGASNAQTLSDILRQGIFVHANELRVAKAMVDGNLVSTPILGYSQYPVILKPQLIHFSGR
jgi:hypothetical protein